MRIDNLSALKQYISTLGEMSNSSEENLKKLTINSLSISDLLEDLSLNLTKENKLIAQELLKANLPLDKNLITDLNQFLTDNNFSDSLQNKIKIAILLKQLKLPLNQKFFKVFANYGKNPKSLPNNLKQLLAKHINLTSFQAASQETKQQPNLTTPQLLKQLQLTPQTKQQLNIKINQQPITIIKKLISNLTNSQSQLPNRQTILNNLKQIINNQPQLLTKLTQQVSPDKLTKFLSAIKLNNSNSAPPTDQTTITISKIIDQLNLTPEQTDKLNISSTSNPREMLNTIINHLTTNQSDQQLNTKMKNLLRSQPQVILKLQQEFPTDKVSKLLTNISLSPPESKQLLTENLNQIVNETIVTPDNISPEQIKNAVNKLNPNSSQNQLMKLLFNFTASSKENNQLTNETQNLLYQLTSLKAVNTENNVLQLFFPILISNNIQLAQLKINQEKQEMKNQEQEILQFSFAVKTDKLGTVEAKVKIYDQQINALFIADNKKTQQLIEEYSTKFEEKFSELDYNLNYFNCKLADDELTTDDKQEIKLNSIDFTI